MTTLLARTGFSLGRSSGLLFDGERIDTLLDPSPVGFEQVIEKAPEMLEDASYGPALLAVDRTGVQIVLKVKRHHVVVF